MAPTYTVLQSEVLASQTSSAYFKKITKGVALLLSLLQISRTFLSLGVSTLGMALVE